MSQLSRSVTAEDERGRKWIVYDGDMAWDLCHKLSLAGVNQIALPASTFLSADVRLPDNLPVIDQIPVELLVEELKPHIIRTIRLRDCVAFLQETSP